MRAPITKNSRHSFFRPRHSAPFHGRPSAGLLRRGVNSRYAALRCAIACDLRPAARPAPRRRLQRCVCLPARMYSAWRMLYAVRPRIWLNAVLFEAHVSVYVSVYVSVFVSVFDVDVDARPAQCASPRRPRASRLFAAASQRSRILCSRILCRQSRLRLLPVHRI
jgi:hypothetical protein